MYFCLSYTKNVAISLILLWIVNGKDLHCKGQRRTHRPIGLILCFNATRHKAYCNTWAEIGRQNEARWLAYFLSRYRISLSFPSLQIALRVLQKSLQGYFKVIFITYLQFKRPSVSFVECASPLIRITWPADHTRRYANVTWISFS